MKLVAYYAIPYPNGELPSIELAATSAREVFQGIAERGWDGMEQIPGTAGTWTLAADGSMVNLAHIDTIKVIEEGAPA